MLDANPPWDPIEIRSWPHFFLYYTQHDSPKSKQTSEEKWAENVKKLSYPRPSFSVKTKKKKYYLKYIYIYHIFMMVNADYGKFSIEMAKVLVTLKDVFF